MSTKIASSHTSGVLHTDTARIQRADLSTVREIGDNGAADPSDKGPSRFGEPSAKQLRRNKELSIRVSAWLAAIPTYADHINPYENTDDVERASARWNKACRWVRNGRRWGANGFWDCIRAAVFPRKEHVPVQHKR